MFYSNLNEDMHILLAVVLPYLRNMNDHTTGLPVLQNAQLRCCFLCIADLADIYAVRSGSLFAQQ